MIYITQLERPETREQPQAVALDDEQVEALLVADVEPTGVVPIVTTQSASGGMVVRTTRQSIGRIVMFNPQGVRKEIPTRDAKENYRNGWRFKCPLCGKGGCGGIFGGCETRPIEAWMRCPIDSCSRTIRDRQLSDGARAGRRTPDKGTEVVFQAQTTSRDRLVERLRRHMLAFHRGEAPLYGFYPDGSRSSLWVDKPSPEPAQTWVSGGSPPDEPPSITVTDAGSAANAHEVMSLDELQERYPPSNPDRGNPKGYAYVCGICGEGLPNSFRLNSHISKMHKAPK